MSTTSDAVTTDPVSARIILQDVPLASPGKCYLCGKYEHPQGFAAPANMNFDYYGTVIFCADCCGDFARLFGYISPEQAIMLAKRVQFLEEQLELRNDALTALESSVEHLTNYRMLSNAITDTGSDASVSGTTDAPSETVDEAASGTVIKFPGDATSTESPVNESNSEQRPNDIPVTTGDNGSTIDVIPL